MNPAAAYALQVFLNWSHLLVPVVPFAVVAVRTTQARRRSLLWLVAALFLLDMACVLSPHIPFVPGGWNWQGKALECFWVLAFVAIGYGGGFRDLALGWQPAPRERVWPALAAAGALAMLFPLYGLFAAGFRMPSDAETLLFEMTLPGLAEEMVFRGVFQSLLNQVFGRPWKLLGAQVGWGYIITTALFTLGHGIFVDKSLHLQTSLFAMLPALYAGLILGWMRERAGSIWPGVVVHNATNTAIVVGSMLLP